MSRKKEIRDYEELLDFAREELKVDQQTLIRMRNLEADPKKLEELENEIDLLNEAVDRYQKKIKVLKDAIQESENQS
jgi:DNA repair ATPase RecN